MMIRRQKYGMIIYTYIPFIRSSSSVFLILSHLLFKVKVHWDIKYIITILGNLITFFGPLKIVYVGNVTIDSWLR